MPLLFIYQMHAGAGGSSLKIPSFPTELGETCHPSHHHVLKKVVKGCVKSFPSAGDKSSGKIKNLV